MIKAILLALIFLYSNTFATAQLQTGSEQDKQALRDIKAVYEQAMESGDLATLQPLLADDFSAIMITGEKVESFSELESFWQQALEFIGKDSQYSVSIDTDDSIFI